MYLPLSGSIASGFNMNFSSVTSFIFLFVNSYFSFKSLDFVESTTVFPLTFILYDFIPDSLSSILYIHSVGSFIHLFPSGSVYATLPSIFVFSGTVLS